MNLHVTDFVSEQLQNNFIKLQGQLEVVTAFSVWVYTI